MGNSKRSEEDIIDLEEDKKGVFSIRESPIKLPSVPKNISSKRECFLQGYMRGLNIVTQVEHMLNCYLKNISSGS